MDTMCVWEGKRGVIQGEMGYRSFLLRLWCLKKNDKLTWRISLENPRTGQKHIFSSLEALHEFLMDLEQVLESEMEKQDGL
jgi:hypothetical protein